MPKILSINQFLACACLVCGFASPVFGQSQFGHMHNWSQENSLDTDTLTPSIVWEVEIGEGRSQVVGDDERVFVATGSSKKTEAGQASISQTVYCLDAKTGEEVWQHVSRGVMDESQETFGGAQATPQASPALVGNSLIQLSFSGSLVCLDQKTGELKWELDAVKELNAEHVQFGFSSSPVFDPNDPSRLYVLAGGKTGGLYCLKTETGEVNWKSSCKTNSYATPVFAKFQGVNQICIVNENDVRGISQEDGNLLWKYELPEKGMTNVPTPIVLDQSRLAMSGQGCKGSRCLEIQFDSSENKWTADEIWFNRRIQYFYTNWFRQNQNTILGCTDKYLAAINSGNGETLGRWRGFGDGNVFAVGERLFISTKKGNLEVLNMEKDKLVHTSTYEILKARCWTPPTLIKANLYMRGDRQLVCVDLNGSKKQIRSSLAKVKALEFTKTAAQPKFDSVQLIFDTFESKGQQAALKLYTKLRKSTPTQLSVEQRIELVNSANQQGLSDLAKMIVAHGLEDFPSSKKLKAIARKQR
ncbi:MAG: PQQ-binding-like beta-propeller repeat protein [Mariniblastus sp.]